jgi:hypothetical protein
MKVNISEGLGHVVVKTDDLGDLDRNLAIIMQPCLSAFKANLGVDPSAGYPCGTDSLEDWKEVLDKMILAFELTIEDPHTSNNPNYTEGMDLFAKHFRDLWC